MPSLDEIKYFLTVSKTGNVSRAAELSGLSQPALSHALKRLESELGVTLLNREKTGVRMTRAGERFAAEARGLVDKWEALSASIKSSDGVVAGHFKLGCHPSVAIYSLPHFLKDLLSEHPALEVSLHHGLSREIANDIIGWKIDFGLVINPPPHPDLVIKELATDEVTLWVGDKYLDDTLIVESNMFQSQNLMKQLEKKKITFARKIESSNLEVIQALTVSGCGVGILPTRVAKAAIKPLKRFSQTAPVFKDRLCLIYRSGQQHNASARVIIDAIQGADI